MIDLISDNYSLLQVMSRFGLSLVCIFANYPFTPIYIRDCKVTEYFEDMQSPQIGIFATHSFPNTNYLLLIYNRRLGWLFFF